MNELSANTLNRKNMKIEREKGYEMPDGYNGNTIWDIPHKHMINILTVGEIHLFNVLCSVVDRNNELPFSKTASFKSMEIYFSENLKNSRITDKTIKKNMNALVQYGIVGGYDYYMINPFVFSVGDIEKWVYDLFAESKITIESKKEFKKRKLKVSLLEENEKLYLVQFTSETDSFLKIGITKRGVEQRFSCNIEPYTYETILLAEHESPRIIERAIKGKFTRYIPEIDILRNNGSTECFHVDDKEDIVAEITNLINNRDFS